MCFWHKRNHAKNNQKNYNKDAKTHNKLGLNSTLYLAYRDIPQLLETHVFTRIPKRRYRFLDFGCGGGFSTQLIANMFVEAGHELDVYGVDINEPNLKLARERLPNGTFSSVDSLKEGEKFDFIVCNFVLVELTQEKMRAVLQAMKNLLAPDGVLLVSNCNAKVYKIHEWYGFNSDFSENKPHQREDGKWKFNEDQSVKLEVINHDTHTSFSFFDFFHSGKAYCEAYKATGLHLAATHKPLGKKTDGLAWKSETTCSPYKIHILYNQPIKLISEEKRDIPIVPRLN